MLHKLEIYALYGLYNYKLDFTDGEDPRLKIITGPNGYGKTTILQVVYALFCKDLDVFFRTPFSHILFFMDDYIIQVKQTRVSAPVEEESDLPSKETVRIAFEQVDAKTGKMLLLQTLEENEKDAMLDGQLELLLNSMKCFFLTDKRILLRNKEQEKRVQDADTDSSMIGVAENLSEAVRKDENDKRIAMFKELVSFFSFADKEMVVDDITGIRFRMRNAAKTLIPVTSLSSGEKHVLLQLYELIFEGRSGDIVLIDEPELSFHPAWLNVYVSVLEKIQDFKLGEGREMQIILATHAPLLIGGRWNETLDLYTLRNNG